MFTKIVEQNYVFSILNVAYISESFSNEILTARCICPKSCYITHYRVSTSYASANQKRYSGYGMSGEFHQKLKTSLERSIDTREWVVPKIRQNNIEQTKAISITYMLDDDSTLLSILHEILNNSYIKKFEKSYTFILEMGFEKIETVLNKAFKAAWDNINFDICIWESEYSASFLWDKYVQVSKLLKRFDEVQRTYRDVVPLLNFQTTPEGRYDSIYLPRTLFNQSEETLETYRRIRRHIETLYKTLQSSVKQVQKEWNSEWNSEWKSGWHPLPTWGKFKRSTRGFQMRLSLNTTIEMLSNYTRSSNTTTAFFLDLQQYESVVINKPLEHLKNAKRKFVDRKIHITAKNGGLEQHVDLLRFTLNKFTPRLVSLRDALDKCNITTYLQHLEDEKHVSKLKLADRFMSENISEHITHVKASSLSHISQQFDQCVFYIQEVDKMVCELYAAAGSEPILQEMYDKLFNYYNNASSSEKEEMVAYFKLDDPDGYHTRLMRGEMSLDECHNATTRDISNEAEDLDIW